MCIIVLIYVISLDCFLEYARKRYNNFQYIYISGLLEYSNKIIQISKFILKLKNYIIDMIKLCMEEYEKIIF